MMKVCWIYFHQIDRFDKMDHLNSSRCRDGIFEWLRKEVLIVGRFAVIGVTATMVHMVAVWTLIEKASISPLLANLYAFLTAFCVSFAGHYLWTFGAPGNPIRALRRLLLISSSAFLVNSILLVSLLDLKLLSPSFSSVLAAAIVPAITFFASRFWGFRKAPDK